LVICPHLRCISLASIHNFFYIYFYSHPPLPVPPPPLDQEFSPPFPPPSLQTCSWKATWDCSKSSNPSQVHLPLQATPFWLYPYPPYLSFDFFQAPLGLNTLPWSLGKHSFPPPSTSIRCSIDPVRVVFPPLFPTPLFFFLSPSGPPLVAPIGHGFIWVRDVADCRIQATVSNRFGLSHRHGCRIDPPVFFLGVVYVSEMELRNF